MVSGTAAPVRLNFDELKRSVKALMLRHVGKENAISRAELKELYHVKDDRRIRLAIWDLNVKDSFPICSVTGSNPNEPTGYFFPADVKEAVQCRQDGIDRAKMVIMRVSHLPMNTARYYEMLRTSKPVQERLL